MATAAQIQQELSTWNDVEIGSRQVPDAVSEELWAWSRENHKSIDIPSGTVALVENYGGGEGDGEKRYIVIKVGDQLFQYVGYYSSWDGTDWDDELYEVEAYEVTVTKYRLKKD